MMHVVSYSNTPPAPPANSLRKNRLQRVRGTTLNRIRKCFLHKLFIGHRIALPSLLSTIVYTSYTSFDRPPAVFSGLPIQVLAPTIQLSRDIVVFIRSWYVPTSKVDLFPDRIGTRSQMSPDSPIGLQIGFEGKASLYANSATHLVPNCDSRRRKQVNGSPKPKVSSCLHPKPIIPLLHSSSTRLRRQS
jgi:hypothetical protein